MGAHASQRRLRLTAPRFKFGGEGISSARSPTPYICPCCLLLCILVAALGTT